MARRKLLDRLIVIDIESTCWEEGNFNRGDGQKSEIIEIGVCAVDLFKREIVKSESIIVKPTQSTVSEFCTKLTTLAQADVDKGILLEAACNKLRTEYHVGDRAWASWGDYDRVQFERETRRKNLRLPFGRTHLNITTLFSIFKGHLKELGVSEAMKSLGMQFEGTPHRGIDDAKNISKLFLHLLPNRDSAQKLPSSFQSVYR